MLFLVKVKLHLSFILTVHTVFLWTGTRDKKQEPEDRNELSQKARETHSDLNLVSVSWNCD